MIFDGIDEAVTERVFYELLVRVGAIGKYQYICLIIWATIYMLSASVLFFNPFLFYQAPYSCPGLSPTDCYNMVCSLPNYMRNDFIIQDDPTWLDGFGDFRCENSNVPKYVESIIYAAGVTGILIATSLNSCIRKKLLVQISLVIAALCFITTVLVKNFTIAVISLCINFACQTILSDLIVCFITQTVHQNDRDGHMMVLFIFFSLGAVMNGILFKFFYWQDVFIYYFVGLSVLSGIGLVLYVKETPFDLVTCFTPEEAQQQFHSIAIQNGNYDKHRITIQELRIMRADYDESLRKKQKINIHVFDLFRFDSLRMDTIVCCIFHFFIYYNYSAPILALDQFSNDIYINDIVFSAATLASSIMCYFVIEVLPRKKMVYYTMFVCNFFVIPMYLAADCKDNCSTFQIIETVSMVLFRVLLEISYQAFYLIQNELFPTQIRSFAILLTAIIANLVPVCIPLVNSINESFVYFLPSTLILSSFIVILSAYQLHETLNVPPPEIIAQLAYKSSSKPFPVSQ